MKKTRAPALNTNRAHYNMRHCLFPIPAGYSMLYRFVYASVKRGKRERDGARMEYAMFFNIFDKFFQRASNRRDTDADRRRRILDRPNDMERRTSASDRRGIDADRRRKNV